MIFSQFFLQIQANQYNFHLFLLLYLLYDALLSIFNNKKYFLNVFIKYRRYNFQKELEKRLELYFIFFYFFIAFCMPKRKIKKKKTSSAAFNNLRLKNRIITAQVNQASTWLGEQLEV